jgi:hypothetical protein
MRLALGGGAELLPFFCNPLNQSICYLHLGAEKSQQIMHHSSKKET